MTIPTGVTRTEIPRYLLLLPRYAHPQDRSVMQTNKKKTTDPQTPSLPHLVSRLLFLGGRGLHA